MYNLHATIENANSKKPNTVKPWASNESNLVKINIQKKTLMGNANSVLTSPKSKEFFSETFGKFIKKTKESNNSKQITDNKIKIFSTQENHSSRESSEDCFYTLICDYKKTQKTQLPNNQHYSPSHPHYANPQNSLVSMAELFEGSTDIEYKNAKDCHSNNDNILPKIQEKYETIKFSENFPGRKTLSYISQSPLKNRKQNNHFTITPELNRVI